MKTCPTCGLELEPDALFCPDDGTHLPAVMAHEDAPTAVAALPPELKTESEPLDDLAGMVAWRSLCKVMDDPQVEDIYVLGPKRVVVAGGGSYREVPGLDLGGHTGLDRLARAVARQNGREVDSNYPFADGRLPDGSRVHVSLGPAADPGPQLVIRHARSLFGDGDDRLARLINLGTLTPRAALLLRLAVKSGVSLLVAGATAAGKTTFISALGAQIPLLDPLVCIEDTRELDFPGANISYITARPGMPGGPPAITPRFLVQQALRKRPHWIVLGEARGEEAWDFAQAGNTGHAILASVHANGCRDALERYRDLCLEASSNLGETTALRSVLRAFRLAVYLEFDKNSGKRVVKHIVDVTGNVTESSIPVLQDLFVWDSGALRCTRSRPYPRLAGLLNAAGFDYENVVAGTGIPRGWDR